MGARDRLGDLRQAPIAALAIFEPTIDDLYVMQHATVFAGKPCPDWGAGWRRHPPGSEQVLRRLVEAAEMVGLESPGYEAAEQVDRPEPWRGAPVGRPLPT